VNFVGSLLQRIVRLGTDANMIMSPPARGTARQTRRLAAGARTPDRGHGLLLGLMALGVAHGASAQTTHHLHHHAVVHKTAAHHAKTAAKTVAAHHMVAAHHGVAHKPLHAPVPVVHPHPLRPVPPHHARHVATGAVVAGGVAAAAAGAAAAAPAADAPPAAAPQIPAPTDKGSNTGLPLPRFAAFRAGEVNMRSGPGERYPIQWVYHRRDLPVKIEREFDVWRLVEDSDGEKGWVHQAVLTGTRTFVIPGLPPEGTEALPGEQTAQGGDHIGRADTRVIATVPTAQDAAAVSGGILMRAGASDTDTVVAVLKPGVVGVIRQCPVGSDWCKVTVKTYNGWLHRGAFWGLLPQEAIQP